MARLDEQLVQVSVPGTSPGASATTPAICPSAPVAITHHRQRMLAELVPSRVKITGAVVDTFEGKPNAPYQANRYALATCQRIFFTSSGIFQRKVRIY
jgi:hypothetical protein